MKVEIKEVKISEIKLNPDNPRRISKQDMDRLVKSLTEFPDMLSIREIVVDETMTILGGNMRYLALKKSGAKTATAKIVTGLTKEQKREFVIKDNSNFGEYDFDALANGWSDLPLADWGVDLPEDWLGGVESEPKDAEPQIDRAEELNKTWGVKLGDLWQIGEHRLLCGDSTKKEDVGRVMGEEKADISFMSPPYNAGCTPTEIKMGKTSKYSNDSDSKSESEYLSLLLCATKLTLDHSDYSFVNIQSLSGNKTVLIDFLYHMKNVYADTLIWQKQTAQPAMANNVLNSQFEYVHCFSHKANRAIGAKQFRGTISNVIEISKQTGNKVKEHNATFPLEFALFFVSNFSIISVIDLFLGSGTTMVACQNLNRKCRGIEISPSYCAVILQRMTDAFPNIEIKRLP
jgi:DNA modification methylase